MQRVATCLPTPGIVAPRAPAGPSVTITEGMLWLSTDLVVHIVLPVVSEAFSSIVIRVKRASISRVTGSILPSFDD
ncbi:unannotated protein [freshwater metagenome]|uniref:Unannotated protein n=1 Tax=freshwater metagenome TaxID=449393 RepID=A0A6J6X4P0_9ZZZZ